MFCRKCGLPLTPTDRFAFAGWWYQRYRCTRNDYRCMETQDVCERQVDQNDLRDCEAADASQGIV